MKCPHPIEPHQIQGLDFIHMYPVVQVILIYIINVNININFTFNGVHLQWLVKKALETRGEREAANRAYSLR